MITKKLCEKYPPSKKEPYVFISLPREQEEAAISSRISDMLIYLALERLSKQAVHKGDIWARDVWEDLKHEHLSIQEESRISWLNRLEGDAREFAQQVFQQPSDPFAPYSGSSIENAADNIEGSTFGKLIQIVLPEFYDSKDHQEVVEFLFPLLVKGTYKFLQDM